MRIAIFVPIFPLISETFILRQITGLLDMGHEVDIYSGNRPRRGSLLQPEVSRYDLLARTTYVDVPSASGYWEMPVLPFWGRTWLPGSTRAIPNALRLAQALPAFARSIRRSPRLVVKVLKLSEYGLQARSLSSLYRLAALCKVRKHYDLLHAHFGPAGNAFRFARELWNAPLVVSFHGYDFSALPKKEGPGLYARLFDTADVVTVNSGYAHDRMVALGCPPPKIHKLPMGVDITGFPFQERTLGADQVVRVLTVGRLVEKKGVEYAIRAFAVAYERHPNMRYDIIGDGPLRPKLEALSKELRVSEAVFFHGARPSDYVKRTMQAAHLFVLASITATDGDEEGQGLVLQEAQASGLPVLATDHNGFSESILPGRSGYLLPERNSTALAERLISLVENPSIWAEMGRAGHKHVEAHYDIRKLNAQLAELYNTTVREYARVA